MKEVLSQNPNGSMEQTAHSINVFIGILALVAMGVFFLRWYIVYLMSDSKVDISPDEDDEDFIW